MKMRMLRAQVVDALSSSIRSNLHLYRDGNFSYLQEDFSKYIEIDFDIDENELSKLTCTKDDLREVANCQIMFNALHGMTPYIARDFRLWAYLTHTHLLQYTRERWPLPEEDDAAVNHIKTHFFGKAARDIERDNSASRLWWMAYICSRVKGMPLEQSLSCILLKSDVRANIIERPTTSQNITVFSAIVHILSASFSGDKRLFERQYFRPFMKQINLKGGEYLLDALDSLKINALFESVASDVSNG